MKAMRTAMRSLQRLAYDQRGQAMVEYSTITFMILIVIAGSGVGMPLFNGQSLVHALYSALQVYVNSIFYSLSLSVI
jgi:Flp pilus assembly pilin Flp